MVFQYRSERFACQVMDFSAGHLFFQAPDDGRGQDDVADWWKAEEEELRHGAMMKSRLNKTIDDGQAIND